MPTPKLDALLAEGESDCVEREESVGGQTAAFPARFECRFSNPSANGQAAGNNIRGYAASSRSTLMSSIRFLACQMS